MDGKRTVHGDDGLPDDVSGLDGWGPARVVVDPATVKLPTKRITINLDADVIAIFKADALRGGPPYQVAINQALRSYLHQREVDEERRHVDAVLAALEDSAVRAKISQIVKAS